MKILTTTFLLLLLTIGLGQSKVVLSTDQSYYFSGESMHISIFAEAMTNRTTILDVSVLNDANQMIYLRKVNLTDGIGSLQIPLGEELAGKYELQLHDRTKLIGTKTVQVISRSSSPPLYYSDAYFPSENVSSTNFSEAPTHQFLVGQFTDEETQNQIEKVQSNHSTLRAVLDSLNGRSIEQIKLIEQMKDANQSNESLSELYQSKFKLNADVEVLQDSLLLLSQQFVEKSSSITNDLVSIEIDRMTNELQVIQVVWMQEPFTTNQNAQMALHVADPEVDWIKAEITISNRLDKNSIKELQYDFEEQTYKLGQVIRGKLNDANDERLNDHPFVMIVPSTNEVYGGKTNEFGVFELEITPKSNDFFGIFLSVFNHNNVAVQIEENSKSTFQISQSESGINVTDQLQNLIINESFGTGNKSDKNQQESRRKRYENQYDSKTDPRDYLSLKTVGETLNDVVPRVYVTKGKFRVIPQESTIRFPKPPLFFVEGVPTYDYEYILNLDVNKVKSIGTILSKTKLRNFYHAGSGGIVEFLMVDSFDASEVPLSQNIAKFQGIPQAEIVSLPDASTDQVSFSSLLHWNPNVRIEKNNAATIDFRTSYESGKYTARVQGITSKGEYVSLFQDFEITQKIPD